MKKSPDETLKAFGMDPKRILEERQKKAHDWHHALFAGVGDIVTKSLDLCEQHGFGNASKMRVLQGITEPGLFALAIACTYKPDLAKEPPTMISHDSVLFAALFMVTVTDHITGQPEFEKQHAVEAAHRMFEKITGRIFRDVFIDSCGCKYCTKRRERTGIKFDPNAEDNWL